MNFYNLMWDVTEEIYVTYGAGIYALLCYTLILISSHCLLIFYGHQKVFIDLNMDLDPETYSDYIGHFWLKKKLWRFITNLFASMIHFRNQGPDFRQFFIEDFIKFQRDVWSFPTKIRRERMWKFNFSMLKHHIGVWGFEFTFFFLF